MKTTKCVEVYRSDYRTHADVIARPPHFIDKVYSAHNAVTA